MSNVINGCARLCSQVDAIEATLKQTDSVKICHRLFHKLDETLHAFSELRQRAGSVDEFAQSHLKQLEEKIVSLYGDIVNKSVDYEVLEIRHEAEHLEAALLSGNEQQIEKEAAALNKHILMLTYNHALSLENLSIIARAEASLKKADEQLHPTLKKLAPEAQQPAEFAEPDAEDIELGEALYEIFYEEFQNKRDVARSKFNRLPQSTQRRVAHHEMGLHRPFAQDTRARALLAAANEAIGTGRQAPSPAEVRMMQKDLHHILRESAS